MLRIGLLYPSKDPTSPSNWSGTPRGLTEGLKALGATVVPIPCQSPFLPRLLIGLRRRMPSLGYMTLDRRPVFTRMRSAAIAKSIENAGPLDGIIAMGTDFYDLRLAADKCTVPIATYDDGTFALFLRYPDSDITRLGLPDKEVDAWVKLQQTACRRATIACVSTQWAKRSVVDDFGVPDERVHVVGMGHRPRPAVAQRDYTTPHFLFVGVEWKRKNGAAVLAAFAEVRRQVPLATLAIVGDHPPIDQPGVTGYGFLPLDVPEAQCKLDRLFAEATVFVLPSLFDPSPIAYLEAASCGLPVIATNCGGAGELLKDAAITINPHNPNELLDAMMRLTDVDLARRMGKSALERSASATWRDVSRRILDGLQIRDQQARPVAEAIETAAGQAFSG